MPVSQRRDLQRPYYQSILPTNCPPQNAQIFGQFHIKGCMTYGRVRWYPLETNQKSPVSDLLPCNCSFQSPIFWDPRFQDTTGTNLHFASEQQLPPEWSIWTRSRPSGSWILSKSPIDTTNLFKKRTYLDFSQFFIFETFELQPFWGGESFKSSYYYILTQASSCRPVEVVFLYLKWTSLDDRSDNQFWTFRLTKGMRYQKQCP